MKLTNYFDVVSILRLGVSRALINLPTYLHAEHKMLPIALEVSKE